MQLLIFLLFSQLIDVYFVSSAVFMMLAALHAKNVRSIAVPGGFILTNLLSAIKQLHTLQ